MSGLLFRSFFNSSVLYEKEKDSMITIKQGHTSLFVNHLLNKLNYWNKTDVISNEEIQNKIDSLYIVI